MLGTGSGGRLGNNRVMITGVEETPLHQKDLRTRLLSFFWRAGVSSDPDAPLDALVGVFSAWTRQPKR
jgi:hypothetical protein